MTKFAYWLQWPEVDPRPAPVSTAEASSAWAARKEAIRLLEANPEVPVVFYKVAPTGRQIYRVKRDELRPPKK